MKEHLQSLLESRLVFPDDTNLQQRGIADRIENDCNRIITEEFDNVTPARSRRSIEDIRIGDYYVDHKSSDASLKFKMPNLISIDRLRSLDKPLLFNFVTYDSKSKKILSVMVLDVYELDWNHLSIQNLGVGQLQIKNMTEFLKSPRTPLTKDEWIIELQNRVVIFYKKLIKKTEQRMNKWSIIHHDQNNHPLR
jgi:hypothetical protein